MPEVDLVIGFNVQVDFHRLGRGVESLEVGFRADRTNNSFSSAEAGEVAIHLDGDRVSDLASGLAVPWWSVALDPDHGPAAQDGFGIFGRCGRDESCEGSAGTIGGLPRKLHLFNGDLLNARISSDGSRLSQLHSVGQEPMEIVEAFYLAALTRRPSEQEREHWIGRLASLKSASARRAFLEDFVWGLMACSEFVTNH